jgi:hypothetical protein
MAATLFSWCFGSRIHPFLCNSRMRRRSGWHSLVNIKVLEGAGTAACPGVNDSGLRGVGQPRVSEPGRLLPLLCGALSAVRPHGKRG